MTKAEAAPVRHARAARPRKSGQRGSKTATPKEAVVEAALAHVPFDGFTDKVLHEAGVKVGVDRAELARLFPKGPLSLVEAFSEVADADMERDLAKAKLSKLKVREKITLAVRTRIGVIRPHKEAARRAAAFLSLPPNAPTGARLLYRTVDSIWHAIGDTSTDFNFYTKRAVLAAVYSSTLMRWFNDDSDDASVTDAFLARRIDNVMQFEKLKAELRERAKKLPSLSEILSRSAARRT